MKKILLIACIMALSLGGFAQTVNSTTQDTNSRPNRSISNQNKQAIEKASQKRKKASDARQAASDTIGQKQRLRPDSLRRGGAMKVDTL